MATSTFPTMMRPIKFSSMRLIRLALGSTFRLIPLDLWDIGPQLPLIPMMLCTFPIKIMPMTTSSMLLVHHRVHLHLLGPRLRLIPLGMWDLTPQSPLTPMMLCTFPTMMIPIKNSSMRLVHHRVHLHLLGPRFRLTLISLPMWDITPQLPSIPTMLCTFPTMLPSIKTSSMRLVHHRVHLHLLGPRLRLLPLGMWDLSPQSPLTPMMLCTFPTMMAPMTTSSMLLVHHRVHLHLLGPRLRLIPLGMWEFGPQLPLIPMMLCTFPTMIPPIKTSSMRLVHHRVHLHLLGPRLRLIPLGMWDLTPQSPLTPMMLCTFPTVMPPIPTSSTLFLILLRISMAIRSVQTCLQD